MLYMARGLYLFPACAILMSENRITKDNLCSSCAALCRLRAAGQEAKMEAGENPARSRHCKEGAFSDHVGMSCKVQGIFIKPLRTRQISRKRS